MITIGWNEMKWTSIWAPDVNVQMCKWRRRRRKHPTDWSSSCQAGQTCQSRRSSGVTKNRVLTAGPGPPGHKHSKEPGNMFPVTESVCFLNSQNKWGWRSCRLVGPRTKRRKRSCLPWFQNEEGLGLWGRGEKRKSLFQEVYRTDLQVESESVWVSCFSWIKAECFRMFWNLFLSETSDLIWITFIIYLESAQTSRLYQ